MEFRNVEICIPFSKEGGKAWKFDIVKIFLLEDFYVTRCRTAEFPVDERSTVSISSVFKLGTVGNGNGTHDRASINVKTRKFMAHRSRACGVVNLRIDQRTRWGFSIRGFVARIPRESQTRELKEIRYFSNEFF